MRTPRLWAGIVALGALAVITPAVGAAPNPVPPGGFRADVVLGSNGALHQPVAVAFAADGHVFVAEKNGVIKVYDSLSDPSPSVFVDLSTEVYSYSDHGLLGLAVDPQFPARPYVYALFTRDAATPGGPVPAYHDGCASAQGCATYSRLVRYTASGDVATGHKVLLDGWCDQFAGHGIGTVKFGNDGMLYAGAGDGAGYSTIDYGQFGNPTKNPCGDPPGGRGVALAPPTAEGGSLRSQDVATDADPAGLDGAIIRIDPNTGAAASGNPFASNPDANKRRVLAFGLRNPYRFTFRPSSNELWIGDVGWNYADEIDRVADTTNGTPHNFGWPCYEGTPQQPAWQAAALDVCTSLYGASGTQAAAPPAFEYVHGQSVVPGETCASDGSALSGLVFYRGTGSYPASYKGGLFFADYTRQCIWFAPAGSNGQPDFSRRRTFMVLPNGYPTDLELGPNGDVYFTDIANGTVSRIRYYPGDQPPTARAHASATSGPVPLTVHFDGRSSSDPTPGDTLTYAWDLDGDGTYNDASTATAWFTYRTPGPVTAGLRVTDSFGISDTTSLTVTPADAPPLPIIVTPTWHSTSAGQVAFHHWAVGDHITFSGVAFDANDGLIAASQLHWDLLLHHCYSPTSCHIHYLEQWDGLDNAAFDTPDHAYPSYLELQLTATDSVGNHATASVRINPATARLVISSSPPGATIAFDSATVTTPSTQTVIVGSQHTIATTVQQSLLASPFTFNAWSDGGAIAHTVTVGATGLAVAAHYSTKKPARYRIVGVDGTTALFAVGSSAAVTASALAARAGPVVAGAATPGGNGYWRVDAAGNVFASGTAGYRGSAAHLALRQPIVAIAATPSGQGYWLAAADGGIFAFGDAAFHGSLGALHLAKPIVGIAATASGRGYWLVAADGGIFSFGDAHFYGSLGGVPSSSRIVAFARTASGKGYWILDTAGKVARFGDAANYGSATTRLGTHRASALRVTPTGHGYWVIDTTGGVYGFGDAPWLGSLHSVHTNVAALVIT